MPISTKRVTATLKTNNLKNNVQINEIDDLGNSTFKGEIRAQGRTIGIPGQDGAPGIIWLGDYNPNHIYTRGNAVYYLGSSYIYINDNNSSELPSNNSYWDIIALGNLDETYKNMKKLIDEDGSYIYIGFAVPGTDETEALWSIKRIELFEDGDISILWAESNNSYDKSWDQRTTYTYN